VCEFSILGGKVGLGFVQNERANSLESSLQSISLNLSCRNEPIDQSYFKRDLDGANLRPLLEQGCRKQTPSASILFFRGARQARFLSSSLHSLYARVYTEFLPNNLSSSLVQSLLKIRVDPAQPKSGKKTPKTRFGANSDSWKKIELSLTRFF